MKETVDILSDEQAGRLFKLIFEYRETGVAPEIDDGMIKVAFTVIKSKLDMNDRKYQETVEKRRAAGQKGGTSKAMKSKQEEADASTCKQDVANLANASKCQQMPANVANTNTNPNNNTNNNCHNQKSSLEGTA